MPTYVYECQKCEHQFEAQQTFSDKPLKDCPKCKKKKTLEKVICVPAIKFVGEGFYINDYKNKK